MKLRTKLTLVFVILAGLLQLLDFILIYHFAKQYTDRDFYTRLHQRAVIAAQTLLGEDELSKEIYEEVRTIHLQTLPDEKEMIYHLDEDRHIPELPEGSPLTQAFLQKIMRNKNAEMRIGDTAYSGLFYEDNEGDFIVILSASDIYGEGKLDNLQRILMLSFFFSLLITWVLGQYLAMHALSPISRIVKKVKRISATNLHMRLDEPRNKDELAELTVTFNDMLDRLETAFELQGNFVNNASHELRNPLTAILGQIEVALNKPRTEEAYVKLLRGIESEAQRLDVLVNGLLRLAQTENSESGSAVEQIRMDELLVEMKRNMDTANPENQIHLDFSELPQDESQLVVNGNRRLLEVALHNILDNACKFSANKPVLLRLLSLDDGLHLIISDEGIGIPADELKNIYEPFFRGSNARGIEGFGFGLPLAYRIIRMHRGQLRLTSQVGQGTLAKIILPRV